MTFETSNDARDWADEWVARHLPSPVTSELLASERDHAARFERDYGRLAAQFEVQFRSLVELVGEINYLNRYSWPAHRSMQFVLLAYNLTGFHSSMDRLSRGYYEDSIALTRGAYEAFVRALFISCYPDDGWAAFGRPPPGVRTFNLTNFLRDDLGLEWESNYRIMSVFAHANTFQAAQSLQRALAQEDAPELFGIARRFDVRLAELAAPLLQFVLVGYLRLTIEQFVGSILPRNESVLGLANEAMGLLMYGLATHDQEHWKRVAIDLDFLFELLPVADVRGDWKAMVRRRAASV